jgi:hypothetical protein
MQDLQDCAFKGSPVCWDQVNAMLLKEFLKERKKVDDEQETRVQLNLTRQSRQSPG